MKYYTFTNEWEIALNNLVSRVQEAREAAGSAWPLYRDPGKAWVTTPDGDWVGGHWVECLRIASELTGNRELEDEATTRTGQLRHYLERDDMFRGHRFYYGAARQYAWTSNETWRTQAVAAAYAMRVMALKSSGAMPIGTQVQVASTSISGNNIVMVDNAHGCLILDWWAYKQTDDPIFIEGAFRHLDIEQKYFINSDYSTVEGINFDENTGLPKSKPYTLLGCAADSCWSRGQAWAIGGYLRAWEATGNLRYLTIGRRLLDYWCANTDETLVPPYDFKDPRLKTNKAAVPLDTSASTVVAEQLARMAILPDLPPEAEYVVAKLPAFINGLLKHLTVKDDKRDPSAGVLLNGCYNEPSKVATDSELIWGTAYLLFALYYLKTGRVVE